ncbi:substrate-binding periplasmic protein [Aliivibrio kagoshimensis]|uniref:substrate-binding periplasmic protein n=1 Tax=Aliivibrio kagoshimensis TaxID=2910230 RepID=UPI003D0F135A
MSLLLLILLSRHSYAQEDLVFFVVDYPPYMIVGDNNEVSGMDVEVVSAAFKEVGQPVSFDVLPWKRIKKLIEVGEIAGGLSCSKRKGRENYMLFSEYISFTRQAAITHIDFDSSKIKSLNDLKKYSVTTVSGWGTADQLESFNIDYIATKDIRSGLVSVLHRGVDILYGPEIPTMYSAKKMDEKNNIKAIYFDDIDKNELHLCLSKAYPNSSETLRLFNDGLNKIKKNGKYKEIQSHYF